MKNKFKKFDQKQMFQRLRDVTEKTDWGLAETIEMDKSHFGQYSRGLLRLRVEQFHLLATTLNLTNDQRLFVLFGA